MEEIKYLVFTLLTEVSLAVCLLRSFNWKQVFLITVLVNMVSHPIAWFLIFYGWSWWWLELGVALFEGLLFVIIFPSNRIRAGLVAIFMNIVSAVLGLLI